MVKKDSKTSEKTSQKTVSERKGRIVVRTGKEHGRISDLGKQALEEATIIEEKTKKLQEEIVTKAKKEGKKKTTGPKKTHSRRWLEARKKVDSQKSYPLAEAIKLLKEVSISRFNGSVDAHLVIKKIGLKGEVEFPYFSGKRQKILIVSHEEIKNEKKESGKGKRETESTKIININQLKEIINQGLDYSIIIATPQVMPKLIKYAKILGPRGLMPNPKTETITDKPDQLAKKLAGKTNWKTEAKSPLIHITIGKVNQPEKELEENLKTLIAAVGKQNIKKAVLAPTMGPGIKLLL